MADGGELKAIFKGAQEDLAQAVESAARKMGSFGDATAQNVRDSVAAVQNADGASTDAIRGIQDKLGSDATSSGSSSGVDRLKRILRGEPESTPPENQQDAVPPEGKPDDPPDDEPDEPSRTEWPNPAKKYPKEYVPSTDTPPEVDGPHQNPEDWVGDLNDMSAPGRDNNCAECSRAVDNTWHGEATKPAAMADPDSDGEPFDDPSRMGQWAGQEPVTSSMKAIEKRLKTLGPGSSAVVGCDWKTGGGHWFNAVNDEGAVKAVDGQIGKVEAWPPSKSGVGFDKSLMRHSDAIFFDPNGKVVKP